jgi:hypothetical protein
MLNTCCITIGEYRSIAYLKGIEYRFNHGGENLYKQFIKLYSWLLFSLTYLNLEYNQ